MSSKDIYDGKIGRCICEVVTPDVGVGSNLSEYGGLVSAFFLEEGGCYNNEEWFVVVVSFVGVSVEFSLDGTKIRARVLNMPSQGSCNCPMHECHMDGGELRSHDSANFVPVKCIYVGWKIWTKRRFYRVGRGVMRILPGIRGWVRLRLPMGSIIRSCFCLEGSKR